MVTSCLNFQLLWPQATGGAGQRPKAALPPLPAEVNFNSVADCLAFYPLCCIYGVYAELLTQIEQCLLNRRKRKKKTSDQGWLVGCPNIVLEAQGTNYTATLHRYLFLTAATPSPIRRVPLASPALSRASTWAWSCSGWTGSGTATPTGFWSATTESSEKYIFFKLFPGEIQGVSRFLDALARSTSRPGPPSARRTGSRRCHGRSQV